MSKTLALVDLFERMAVTERQVAVLQANCIQKHTLAEFDAMMAQQNVGMGGRSERYYDAMRDVRPEPFRADKPGWYKMRCGGVVEIEGNLRPCEYPMKTVGPLTITFCYTGRVYSSVETPFDLIEYLGTGKP